MSERRLNDGRFESIEKVMNIRPDHRCGAIRIPDSERLKNGLVNLRLVIGDAVGDGGLIDRDPYASDLIKDALDNRDQRLIPAFPNQGKME